MNDVKARIKKVFSIYLAAFYILSLYIAYIMGVEADRLNKDPHNPRNYEDISKRGTIYSRCGAVIACSVESKKEYFRQYPQGESFEPLAGYLSPLYGKGGLEFYLDDFLRQRKSSRNFIEYITRCRVKGENVYLTIDANLQKTAYKTLAGRRGAIVVLDPRNGEVLALASSPSFEPYKLETDWERLKKNKDSPLLLRPVDGLYPPGSVFKLLTYAACLEEGLVTPEETFFCDGRFPIPYELGTYYVRESGGGSHGTVSASDAITYSCNVAISQMALRLGADKFVKYAEKFGLTDKLNFLSDNQYRKFPAVQELTDSQLAQSSFGQGKVLTSPLRIALMVSAFANQGKIYYPVIIKSRVDEKGKTVFKSYSRIWKTPVSAETAEKVKEAMVETCLLYTSPSPRDS